MSVQYFYDFITYNKKIWNVSVGKRFSYRKQLGKKMLKAVTFK